MSTQVETILSSFEQLSDMEKQEVMSKLIRRTIEMDFPPLTDEELVQTAETLFLEYDKRESVDEKS